MGNCGILGRDDHRLLIYLFVSSQHTHIREGCNTHASLRIRHRDERAYWRYLIFDYFDSFFSHESVFDIERNILEKRLEKMKLYGENGTKNDKK